MARQRPIHAGDLSDPALAGVSDRAARLHDALWRLALDQGHVCADAWWLRAQIWAMRPEVGVQDVAQALQELAQAGLLRLYVVEGRQYALLTRWAERVVITRPAKGMCWPAPAGQWIDVPLELRQGLAMQAAKTMLGNDIAPTEEDDDGRPEGSPEAPNPGDGPGGEQAPGSHLGGSGGPARDGDVVAEQPGGRDPEPGPETGHPGQGQRHPAADAGATPELTAPAALDILRETAGARLALGRKQATATGLTVGEQEHAWTRAWLQAKEAGYTAEDLRRLGLALAERKLWRCERKLSAGDLSRRLLDLLAEARELPAEAPAEAVRGPPAPVVPCEEGWCDGRFHYEQDPDVKRSRAFQCPKRRER